MLCKCAMRVKMMIISASSCATLSCMSLAFCAEISFPTHAKRSASSPISDERASVKFVVVSCFSHLRSRTNFRDLNVMLSKPTSRNMCTQLLGSYLIAATSLVSCSIVWLFLVIPVSSVNSVYLWI